MRLTLLQTLAVIRKKSENKISLVQKLLSKRQVNPSTKVAQNIRTSVKLAILAQCTIFIPLENVRKKWGKEMEHWATMR